MDLNIKAALLIFSLTVGFTVAAISLCDGMNTVNYGPGCTYSSYGAYYNPFYRLGCEVSKQRPNFQRESLWN